MDYQLRFLRWFLLCIFSFAGSTTAEVTSGVLEPDVTLTPGEPYWVKLSIGEAKFLRYSCLGGPADVSIALSTYSENSEPLIFVSVSPDEVPSFGRNAGSSFEQWREDLGGNQYIIVRNVGPRGGILGVANMKHFAGEELNGFLSLQCTSIIAFDTLFWDNLGSSLTCPIGTGQSQEVCSGHGWCTGHGSCECHAGFGGAACESVKHDVVTMAHRSQLLEIPPGKYVYFRIFVPPTFQGGYLKVEANSDSPIVVLVKGSGLPTRTQFDVGNFDDWVNRRNVSVLTYKVECGLAASTEVTNSDIVEPGRLRSADSGPSCPTISLSWEKGQCGTSIFKSCQQSCMHCMSCVKSGEEDGGCIA